VFAAELDPVKHTPGELIRRKKSGRTLDDEQPVESRDDKGPVTWPGERSLQFS
jgi:hypothetical protein